MRVIVTLSFVMLSVFVKADSYLDSLFAKGNTFYQQEQYAQAIESYTQILDSNHISFELFYNLGNSYFQFGKIPKSILFYEKALLIDNSNASCLNNLELARKRIDKIEPIPRLFYVNWWNYFSSLLSFNGWSILLVIAVWKSCILLVFFSRNRKKWIFNSMITTIGFCLLFIFAMLSSNERESQVSAIVMTNSEIYSDTSFINKVGFVKAGNKAIVKDIVSDAALVHLEDGQIAFINISEISLIQ